jgi:hypothetical protein
LSHEQPDRYRQHYLAVQTKAVSRFAARGQAWTLLRRDFPDRYVELYVDERARGRPTAPPDVRSKAWRRATGLLVDLRTGEYSGLFAAAKASGLDELNAYATAVSHLRNRHAETFAGLVAREVDFWVREGAVSWT